MIALRSVRKNETGAMPVVAIKLNTIRVTQSDMLSVRHSVGQDHPRGLPRPAARTGRWPRSSPPAHLLVP